MTVVVSSDTDIYISPGLYGDCLPTVSTDGAADSFRADRVFVLGAPFMLAHAPADGQGPVDDGRGPRLGHRDSRHTDTMSIVKVT
ncbi:hypothetical protein GCM10010330_79380 [Streptomyces tendae]|nr:hypothetical protein GCM10010330_79380 [Streptomyces tendae]